MYCSLVLERTSVASFNKLLSFWVCKLSWLAGSKAPKDRIRQNLLGLSLLSPTRAGTFFSNDLTFEILSRQLPVHFLRSISIFYIKMSSVDLFYHLTLYSKRAKLIIWDCNRSWSQIQMAFCLAFFIYPDSCYLLTWFIILNCKRALIQ